ncbi:predicted protein [Chaetomium globosum CBS 148.51]|uniref:Uncharacterized protein n=1 Tax=Chaetomium globosum (strain ATCC 6205 / CBS 148.51 / DSM 1962 / NBRC 6347 / NRRL 1970) TaxID=306901 RepID=Q2GTC6_CHAGB|nr:uncharacterized protein CHGG_08778 [Chaetomium globosum CBS 148.51]EAQ84764.1 predicted protein [Chaetomium globosum CBS 148.51]
MVEFMMVEFMMVEFMMVESMMVESMMVESMMVESTYYCILPRADVTDKGAVGSMLHFWPSEPANFGSRTTSPAETAHKEIKSEIINGNSKIEQLELTVQRMVNRTKKRFEDESAKQRSAVAFEFLNKTWLGDIPKQVSYNAHSLIRKRYQMALPAVPTPARPFPPTLRLCTGRHRIQYGLPCSHEIRNALEEQKVLRKEDCHRY